MEPPIVPLSLPKGEDPNCPSQQFRNPYGLLGKNFEKNVYDLPIDLFNMFDERLDTQYNNKRDSGHLSNFTYDKFNKN